MGLVDSGLGDALDVITKNLAMTLGASLTQAFTSFSSTAHLFKLFTLLQSVA